MGPSPVTQLLPRQTSSTQQFLSLISDPFSQQISSDAFLASLGTSLGITLLIALLFCLLRPYNVVVYAPRLKHADEKHAPPPVGKGLLAWLQPVLHTKEQTLVDKVGLDATIFLRFTKMCRNIFLVLTIFGCGIMIPVNVVGGSGARSQWKISPFSAMTPQWLFGRILWSSVVCAYVFDIIVCYFLWSNYRAVVRLRRAYFDSPEYQASLHSRTLMVTHIPKAFRTDEGVVRIIDEVHATSEIPRGTIARNVKDLPDLIEEHEKTVRKLEGYFAEYLKNPNKLPANRPTCKPSKKDRAYSKEHGRKVDAIDYLTSRIRELELEIREVRESGDKRNAMPFGFASYSAITQAHSVAYAARRKHPHGSTIRLAPKPNDLIWTNLPLSKSEHRWKTVWVNIWVAVLTVVWIIPNALIAVFLSNLGNLAKVWPAFSGQMRSHPVAWAIVQGVASPAITSLFYFFLPTIFRRLSVRQGDLTKTSRERHVMHKLYAFFVFNNFIVFCLFAAAWGYVAAVVDKSKDNHDAWAAIKEGHLLDKAMSAFCSVSPFWLTWLLHRNLGAAIDLSQVVNLAWGSFNRKFLSPTPRQLIEWSAPPPFDYASYYNYFLFYATVGLCFATVQPLALPVTAFYFLLDSWLKKYLILYVFVTKTESGGQFWRVLFNRFIFLSILANCVVALFVAARGYSWTMLGAMIPLPFLMLGFKWYCSYAFDDQIKYYSKSSGRDIESDTRVPPMDSDKHSIKSDKVAVRFGHPALYKPLMTPMVHAKAQHLLGQVYRGRLDAETDGASTTGGYSESVHLDSMSRDHPGKSAAKNNTPFEFVPEGRMDFEYYKNRHEFREEFGGEGEMYGRPVDLVGSRTGGTPGTFMSRERGRSGSPARTMVDHDAEEQEHDGTTYAQGYHVTPSAGLRGVSPDTRDHSPDIRSHIALGRGYGRDPYPDADAEERGLVRGAAPMGAATPLETPGLMGRGGYVGLEMDRTPGTEEEETSYDYFRRGVR